jgi:hypothetical protein
MLITGRLRATGKLEEIVYVEYWATGKLGENCLC